MQNDSCNSCGDSGRSDSDILMLMFVNSKCQAGSDRAQPGCIDGLGWMARFDQPRQLYLSSPETLLVADTGNHRIRSINLVTS